MDGSIIYFLPTIVLLGLVTSYEDIKYGKILNKYIITAILLGISIHAILIVADAESLNTISKQLLGTVIASATGIFIWYVKWWSAGDAKLFITYAFLFPVTLFENQSSVIPIMVLLATMTLPIWTFLFLRAIFLNPKKITDSLRKSINPKEIISTWLLVLAIPWSVNALLELINLQSNFLLNIATLVVTDSLARRYLRNKAYLFYAAIILLRAAIDPKTLLDPKTLIVSFLIFAAYLIARRTATTHMLRKASLKQKNIKKHRIYLMWKIYTMDRVPFAPIMFLGVLITVLLVIFTDI